MSQEEDNDAALAHTIIPYILLFVRKYCVKKVDGEASGMHRTGSVRMSRRVLWTNRRCEGRWH